MSHLYSLNENQKRRTEDIFVVSRKPLKHLHTALPLKPELWQWAILFFYLWFLTRSTQTSRGRDIHVAYPCFFFFAFPRDSVSVDICQRIMRAVWIPGSNEWRHPGGDSPKLILNHFLILSASLPAFHLLLTHASIITVTVCCYLCLSASTCLLCLSLTTCLTALLLKLPNKDRLMVFTHTAISGKCLSLGASAHWGHFAEGLAAFIKWIWVSLRIDQWCKINFTEKEI